MTPDTVVVISRAAASHDYTPLFSGLAASILVAGMAWYSTRKQAQIATANTQAQRDIADKGFSTQLEGARRTHVIESRRDWIKELRSAVGDFQSAVVTLGYLASDRTRAGGSSERATAFSRIVQQQTRISLLLDPQKSSHEDVILTVRSAMRECVELWLHGATAPAGEQGDAPTKAPEGPSRIGKLLADLDNQVSIIVEAAWTKIKKGE